MIESHSLALYANKEEHDFTGMRPCGGVFGTSNQEEAPEQSQDTLDRLLFSLSWDCFSNLLEELERTVRAAPLRLLFPRPKSRLAEINGWMD